MRTKDRYFLIHFKDDLGKGVSTGLTCTEHGITLAEGEQQGVYLSLPLDSGERGNVWQRVLLNAHCPVDTQISCCLYSISQPYEAQALTEMLQSPYKSLPEKQAALERFKAFETENAEDFLLRGVVGRYLIAAVALSRTGDVSPVLSWLQLYAEQESFLGYLPEIFQDEGGFLDRFLRLFSVQYLALERRIDRLPQMFDPLSAPLALLPWLAEMMGIPHVGLWETETLRELLSHRVYARKGTLSGLFELITLYTGYAPYIAESFRIRTGRTEQDNLYNGRRLMIFLPPDSLNEKRTAETLDMLIQTYVAKEVSYALILLEDRAVVSGYTFLDVNACLSGYGAAVLDEDSRLGNAALGG